MSNINKKNRSEIPPGLAAEVLFRSYRTCCVCHLKNKPLQIHHIDGNPANNVFKNLAVLCLDCHTETQIRGGFHRKLDADQVILYRDDWLVQVAKRRMANQNHPLRPDPQPPVINIELVTSIAEIYHEREEYGLLASLYDSLGNKELRDKYIELAIQKGVDDDTLIYLRSQQERLDLVPLAVKKRCINRLKKYRDWSQLGRLYADLGEHRLAALAFCRSIVEDLEEGNLFAAAFYLKEMSERDIVKHLFMGALEKAHKENDLWWQYRALDELGWHSEKKKFLLEHQQEIEASGNQLLMRALIHALGDQKRVVELEKRFAQTIHIRRLKKAENINDGTEGETGYAPSDN